MFQWLMIHHGKNWRRRFASNHLPFTPDCLFLVLFFLRVLRVLRG